MAHHAQAHTFAPRKRPTYRGLANTADHASLTCRWCWGTGEELAALDDAREAQLHKALRGLIVEVSRDGEITRHEKRRLLRACDCIDAEDAQENAHHEAAADANSRAGHHAGIVSRAMDAARSAANDRQGGHWHDGDEFLRRIDAERVGQLTLLEGE